MRRSVRTVALMLATVVLIASGVYVVVDLARWEWNRAIVSALFFLSMLVVLSTALVLRALRRVEMRLSALERERDAAGPVRATISAANAEHATRHFRWLEDGGDNLTVFVPVLLGAGAVLSFVAYVIERIAGFVAGAALDRRTAELVALDLPLSAAPPIAGIASPARRATSRPRLVARILVATVTVVLAAIAVDVLRQLTQSRPGDLSRPGATSFEVVVRQKGAVRPPEVVATSLMVACQNRLPSDARLVATRTVPGDRVVLVVDRALARTGLARITGCIEDLTLDLVRADVLRVDVEGARVGRTPRSAPSGRVRTSPLPAG